MWDNIILVGYMGCGKTTVGKMLADDMGYDFADTDEMIEKSQDRTISEIFATDGETAFRDMETSLLEKLIDEQRKGLVISTGGGMPIRKTNRELLRRIGGVVYLDACADVIYERLKGDTMRPLLQCDNPREKIGDMISQRGPAYRDSASVIVNVDALTPKEIVAHIKKTLKEA